MAFRYWKNLILVPVAVLAFSKVGYADPYGEKTIAQIEVDAGGGAFNFQSVAHEVGATGFIDLRLKADLQKIYGSGPDGGFVFGVTGNVNVKGASNGALDVTGVAGPVQGLGLDIGWALVNNDKAVVALVGILDFTRVDDGVLAGLGLGSKFVVITPNARGELSIKYLGNAGFNGVDIVGELYRNFDHFLIDDIHVRAESAFQFGGSGVYAIRVAVGLEKFVYASDVFGIAIGLEVGDIITNDAYQSFTGPYAEFYVSMKIGDSPPQKKQRN